MMTMNGHLTERSSIFGNTENDSGMCFQMLVQLEVMSKSPVHTVVRVLSLFQFGYYGHKSVEALPFCPFLTCAAR